MTTAGHHDESGARPRRASAACLAAAAVVLVAFYAAGKSYFNGWALDLGTTLGPNPWYARFLAFWALFGGAAALLAACGAWHGLAERRGRRLVDAWRRVSDNRWIAYSCVLTFVLPVLLRTHLLLGMPLVDDERAYRFAGEILARGRLYLESPPMKLFFDNPFLINDGKLFTQYFIGWPALMVPGIWLGVAGVMNAFYSATAVPALFAVVRRYGGSSWAKVAVALYVASPMLTVGAATETSHPSCLAALTWTLWFFVRTRDHDAPAWAHGGFALLFSIAFFIRPTSALGLGAPLLLMWLSRFRRAGLRGLLAFAVPALSMAALFLAVNKVQHGSWLEVGYNHYYEYAESNGLLFSIWQSANDDLLQDYQFEDPWLALGLFASAIFRFNFAFLGWPSSILFMFLARGEGARLMWWMTGSFLALHFFTNTIGVDTFAPMHYYEVALPGLVLSVLGLAGLTSWLDRSRRALPAFFQGGARPGLLAPLLAAALVGVTWLAYVPVRFKAIHQMAEGIHAPHEALEQAGIARGVVFAPNPFIDRCKYLPSVAFVFSRPNNDPELANDVLWVNHVTLERNRELMTRMFPDRAGYLMAWTPDCRVVFIPLEQLPPGSVPPARGLS